MDGLLLLVWATATGPPDRAGHEPPGLSGLLPVYLPVLSCTCTTSSGAVGMSRLGFCVQPACLLWDSLVVWCLTCSACLMLKGTSEWSGSRYIMGTCSILPSTTLLAPITQRYLDGTCRRGTPYLDEIRQGPSFNPLYRGQKSLPTLEQPKQPPSTALPHQIATHCKSQLRGEQETHIYRGAASLPVLSECYENRHQRLPATDRRRNSAQLSV